MTIVRSGVHSSDSILERRREARIVDDFSRPRRDQLLQRGAVGPGRGGNPAVGIGHGMIVAGTGAEAVAGVGSLHGRSRVLVRQIYHFLTAFVGVVRDVVGTRPRMIIDRRRRHAGTSADARSAAKRLLSSLERSAAQIRLTGDVTTTALSFAYARSPLDFHQSLVLKIDAGGKGFENFER